MDRGTEEYVVVGLRNKTQKYLTQEKFGMKIHASATTMKSKQRWNIEQPEGEVYIYIRSHLNCYLSADEKGNLTCREQTKGKDAKFRIEVEKDGRWAIRSFAHGYFIGGKDDYLHCFSRKKTDGELWDVKLGIHPQVHLRYVADMRYARLSSRSGEITVTEDLPWGQDALITLGFHEGKYTFQTCDDKYLHRDGTLVEEANDDTRFVLELHSGKVAFRDCEGCYLSPVGPGRVLKSRNKILQKDKLLMLEDSYPQGVLLAHNGKYISLKQGEALSANQNKHNLGNKETFQLEYHDTSGTWALRASIDKYWTLGPSSGIYAMTVTKDIPETHFTLEYDGKYLSIKASNDKYITALLNGHIFATADTVTEKEKFAFQLINRPLLVLRGEHGFVGVKSTSKLECNCVTYSLIHLNYLEGAYQFKIDGMGDEALSADDQGNLTIGGSDVVEFTMEFHKQNKVCIRAPNGCLVRGEQRGVFKVDGSKVEPDTLWEY